MAAAAPANQPEEGQEMKRVLALVAMAMLAWTTAAQAQNISGGGATFPYPVYSKWAAAYREKTGIGLNYQAIGSGGGIKQIKSKTITFGASDMPLTAEELNKADLLQFPMIMGGVVLVVNLKGIGSGEITLDGPTLAGIYLGEITSWDDPKIKALNASVTLPSKAIAPSIRRLGHGLPVHQLSFASQPDLEKQGWGQHIGFLAPGPGRQGQCRRGEPDQADGRSHRVRGIRLCQAKQG
jgi:phosphate transport system substrate-binding protein